MEGRGGGFMLYRRCIGGKLKKTNCSTRSKTLYLRAECTSMCLRGLPLCCLSLPVYGGMGVSWAYGARWLALPWCTLVCNENIKMLIHKHVLVWVALVLFVRVYGVSRAHGATDFVYHCIYTCAGKLLHAKTKGCAFINMDCLCTVCACVWVYRCGLSTYSNYTMAYTWMRGNSLCEKIRMFIHKHVLVWIAFVLFVTACIWMYGCVFSTGSNDTTTYTCMRGNSLCENIRIWTHKRVLCGLPLCCLCMCMGVSLAHGATGFVYNCIYMCAWKLFTRKHKDMHL